MKGKNIFLIMLISIFLISTVIVSAQSKEGNFIAAFYYSVDLSKDSGFIVIHNGGDKPEIVKNASLIKFIEDMNSKNWIVIQSNRAPSKTGDYECIYFLFQKKK
jgi:hypothetical protein